MRVSVIYHKDDLDGVFSGAVIKMYEEDGGNKVTLYPMSYSDENPNLSKENTDKVYMADFSLKDNHLFFANLLTQGIECIWIDHHKTAMEAYEDLKSYYEGMHVVLGQGVAACELVWNFLYGGKENKIIEYLSAYDVWDHDRFEWDETLAFQYAMRAKVGLSVKYAENYLRMHSEFSHSFVTSCIKEGKAIINANKRRNAEEVKKYAMEGKVGSYRVLAMNTLEFNSTTFDSMWDEEKYDVMMPFALTPDLKVRASFYTTKDIDCSAIAKSFGGGGHAKAAGATITLDKLMGILKDS